MQPRFLAAVLLVTLLAGCATMPNPFGGQPANPLVAAGSGPAAAPASAPASKDPRIAALAGTGAGPLTGAAAGSYMDQEEADLRMQLQSSEVSVTRVGQQIVLSMPAALAFDGDKAQVKQQFTPVLGSIGLLLKKYDRTLVDIFGYTDSQGADAHNKDLSQRRAVAVAAQLANQGADQRRFYVEGRGEADPVASNATEVGRAQNRRVEIQLSPVS